jgi:hypothetical protein
VPRYSSKEEARRSREETRYSSNDYIPNDYTSQEYTSREKSVPCYICAAKLSRHFCHESPSQNERSSSKYCCCGAKMASPRPSKPAYDMPKPQYSSRSRPQPQETKQYKSFEELSPWWPTEDKYKHSDFVLHRKSQDGGKNPHEAEWLAMDARRVNEKHTRVEFVGLMGDYWRGKKPLRGAEGWFFAYPYRETGECEVEEA